LKNSKLMMKRLIMCSKFKCKTRKSQKSSSLNKLKRRI
jgi:hypothetical protein